MQLLEIIQQYINQQPNQSIPLSKFMEFALYHPVYGYYNNSKPKIGKDGDFITAPEMGDLFAKVLAQQLKQVLQSMPQASILELGAGTGQLAYDLLKQFDEIEYLILEPSGYLQKLQQQKLKDFNNVRWINSLPINHDKLIIIANEVLDALPVDQVIMTKDGIMERQITINNGQLTWVKRPQTKKLVANLIELPELAVDYYTEVNTVLLPWLQAISNCCQQGLMLFIDYGFATQEYFHPERSQGTLMCHMQHQCHSDPLINIGEQDITSHVNFSHLAKVCENLNLDILGYTPLYSFLIDLGITEFLSCDMNYNKQANFLTSPAEMGEIFKVIAIAKNLDLQLDGFRRLNKLEQLFLERAVTL